jgi:hypothetical protein
MSPISSVLKGTDDFEKNQYLKVKFISGKLI